MIDDDFEKNLTKSIEEFLDTVEKEFYTNTGYINEDMHNEIFSTLEDIKETSKDTEGALGVYIQALISDISRILTSNQSAINYINLNKCTPPLKTSHKELGL
jgi:hypothetical protein